MTTLPDLYRNVDDLEGLDWASFDEICIDGPQYQFALLIYARPRLIADQPRGSQPPRYEPRRLVIRTQDQWSEAERRSLRERIAPHVETVGWIDG